jgi:hypothetical protein
VLDDWIEAVCRTVEIPPVGDNERRLVLDMARDVAHGVLRPAAPLSAYLLGVAVGRGVDPTRAAQAIMELARDWPGAPESPDAGERAGAG